MSWTAPSSQKTDSIEYVATTPSRKQRRKSYFLSLMFFNGKVPSHHSQLSPTKRINEWFLVLDKTKFGPLFACAINEKISASFRAVFPLQTSLFLLKIPTRLDREQCLTLKLRYNDVFIVVSFRCFAKCETKGWKYWLCSETLGLIET